MCVRICVSKMSQRTGPWPRDFQDKKKQNRAKYRQNPRRKPGSACFTTDTGREKYIFQQDNNLKHKGKYTLEFLTKMTLNVPEWPGYSFDLNRLENLGQDLKIAVQQ